ncbi:flagellar hook-length control protein FliK [Liquorilactobacillus sucicola DSM 21376 = JCM 15457]|uniref:Flagellar hook-length control protein-like C-terminal domain-containing protein n=2 Tax=Liquorilactobacillus sucicola TaxID=519050 RepID=A0A023CWT2_9LACO|nr:flagellar hook-length control protein FliK [Liquorilactobacillus sucicola]AJA34378.1 flagellar hook-length control protein FliK [Liquorilactobacillus sucicola]KRN06840.1 hypothetical protein FD15_GL000399 [Liquorilactobacillus sucicola DSM 21376 = JCM 15457]GAJ26317.1 flagellar hook-length control protein FliK [Liquorilactobacillus sucicola DSM 21376 = JCM 15457]
MQKINSSSKDVKLPDTPLVAKPSTNTAARNFKKLLKKINMKNSDAAVPEQAVKKQGKKFTKDITKEQAMTDEDDDREEKKAPAITNTAILVADPVVNSSSQAVRKTDAKTVIDQAATMAAAPVTNSSSQEAQNTGANVQSPNEVSKTADVQQPTTAKTILAAAPSDGPIKSRQEQNTAKSEQENTTAVSSDRTATAKAESRIDALNTSNESKEPPAVTNDIKMADNTTQQSVQQMTTSSDSQSNVSKKGLATASGETQLVGGMDDKGKTKSEQKAEGKGSDAAKSVTVDPKNEPQATAASEKNNADDDLQKLTEKNSKNFNAEIVDNSGSKTTNFGVSDNTQYQEVMMQDSVKKTSEKNIITVDDQSSADITQNIVTKAVADVGTADTVAKAPEIIKQVVVADLSAAEMQNPIIADLRPNAQTTATVKVAPTAENSTSLTAAQTSAITRPLVQALKTGTNGASKSLTLQLLPENLGKVRVSLSVTDQQVRLEFKVQSEHAKQMLESISTKLEQVLKNQDFGSGTINTKEPASQVNNSNSLQMDFFNQHSSQRQFGQHVLKHHSKGSLYQEKMAAQKTKKDTKEERTKSTISILA